MNENTKHLLAELIGTFTLVFIGAGAGAMAGTSGGGIVGVALAHGFALVVIVYAWGPISGAHVNPAVTFGVALAGKMEWSKAIGYWVAQLLGGAIAGYTLLYLLKGTTISLAGGATTGLWTLGATADPARLIILEAILTFFLVIAVFGAALAGRIGNAFGVAIGFVLVMDILCGGPLTGASMNPARTFGPAIALGKDHLEYFWMYVVGPLLGGGIAGVLYGSLFLDDKKAPAATR
jgi:MIP family channel proteins